MVLLPPCRTLYVFDRPSCHGLGRFMANTQVVTFQESKYRKVLETVGVFLSCFHGNVHMGIQLARGVLRASCQAAGCGMSGMSFLQAVICREPQQGLQSWCRGSAHLFLQGRTFQDAAAPSQRHTSKLRSSWRQDWPPLLKYSWIRAWNELLQHRKIHQTLSLFFHEISTFLIFSRD